MALRHPHDLPESGADSSKIIQLRTAKKPLICSKKSGFLNPAGFDWSAVGMLQGLGQTRDVDMRVVRTYRRAKFIQV